MNYRYKWVEYARCIRVADQATAFAQIAPDAIVLVMPQDIPKSLKFYCPCGCGEVLSINLMPKLAKAWRVTYQEGRGFSLWPSVWLDIGCKSHFILRNNKALLFLDPVEEQQSESFWDDFFKRTNVRPTD